MTAQILIAGVGMVPFKRPGRSEPYDVMAEAAALAALADARLDYDLVEQAFASHVLADARSGHRALYRVGMTGIPIASVSSCCASGASALHLARQAVLSGESDCVLAVGFDEVSHDGAAMPDELERAAAQLEWLRRERGVGDETFARIVVKARAHAKNNPYAMCREPLPLDAVMAAPALELYASPLSSGAAAIVLCTPRFAARHGVRHGVTMLSQVLVSNAATDPDAAAVPEAPVRDATSNASRRAYALAGVGPEDIDVAEVHDCTVGNELMACASLGFCAEDDFARFVAVGENTYGGRVVIGPSGGMLARGHAPGATGLAQIVELAWQLRGQADARQVPAARTALAHNGARGGAVSVAILQAR